MSDKMTDEGLGKWLRHRFTKLCTDIAEAYKNGNISFGLNPMQGRADKRREELIEAFLANIEEELLK